jgi:molecular chaperone HtpG
LILLPEQMRRMNDIGALVDQRLPGLPHFHVLLVNQKHPLVDGLLKLHSGDPKELANFQSNNLQLMSRLMERGI